MSGFYFIFFLWSIWIIATFIVSKQNKWRNPVAFLSLCLLIIFPYQIKLWTISIQLPSLVILIISYFYLSSLSFLKKMYMVLAIFIIMIGFAGTMLLELYDPVWIFFDRRFLLGFLVFVLVQLLYSRSIPSQFVSTLIGTIQGEILYALILKKWGFPYVVGSTDYLDICAVFLSLMILWSLLNFVISNMSIKNSLEKEKQG